MRNLDLLVKRQRKRLGSSLPPKHLTSLQYQTFSLITPIPEAGRPPALMVAIPIAPPAYGAPPPAPPAAPPPPTSSTGKRKASVPPPGPAAGTRSHGPAGSSAQHAAMGAPPATGKRKAGTPPSSAAHTAKASQTYVPPVAGSKRSAAGSSGAQQTR